ncbi:hypothetical protein CYMTET_48848 [Cymbomonas tetramitiformis]|uniref:cGMP-dependent protein kinase n=1 Tax=Cymbomonas tetramitiformis TaxID=36881 RepID=A0AAE0BRI9_9CHLO|nr:hypothetical protein CYMTET_48848 [Cymbomonas tetramitiformis]
MKTPSDAVSCRSSSRSSFGEASLSCERRLPDDGGPPAKRACYDLKATADVCAGITIFQGLPPQDRVALYANLYELSYEAGETIVRQGMTGHNMYIIIEGSPFMYEKDTNGVVQLEQRLNRGDTVGEASLLYCCQHTVSLSAPPDSRVTVWALSRHTFRNLVRTAAFDRWKLLPEALNHVPQLENLSEIARIQLAEAFISKYFEQGQAILRPGLEPRFHIIVKGQAKILSQDGTHELLGPGSFCGESVLLFSFSFTMLGAMYLSSLFDLQVVHVFPGFRIVPVRYQVASLRAAHEEVLSMVTSRQTCKVNSNEVTAYCASETWSIDQHSLRQVLDKPSPSKDSLNAQPDLMHNLRPDDFCFLKEVGIGLTCQAYLCKMPARGDKHFVLKKMNKARLVKFKQVQNVIRERDLLCKFNSPFIIPCRGYFSDESNLFVVLEFMSNGDLFACLQVNKQLPPAVARLYAAEILLAIEYIHQQGYVYRDLKPENILISQNGHLKLADMGFCKELKDGERKYTTCGTTDYMAPEILLCQGHDKSADLWAFGILVFEMLAGYPPFESDQEKDMIRACLKGDIEFPDDFDQPARDLVKSLCKTDTKQRLGMDPVRGSEEIKAHAFFADVDWHGIAHMLVKPPTIKHKETRIPTSPMKLTSPAKLPITPEQQEMFVDF